MQNIRRFFSPKPEVPPDIPNISIKPIGVVRNRVREPISQGWQEVVSRIIVRPELEEALLGLDTYSHIWVLFWPHLIPERIRGSKPRLHPRDDSQYPMQGILATRSQIRFNPLLTSPVPLLSVRRNVIRVRGLDAVDQSPVLDIKPYIPHHDAIPDARVPGWVLHAVGRDSEERQ